MISLINKHYVDYRTYHGIGIKGATECEILFTNRNFFVSNQTIHATLIGTINFIAYYLKTGTKR